MQKGCEVCPILGGEKAVNETDSERFCELDLADEDFKASIINMLKEHTKEPTENMLTVTPSMGKISKGIKSIRKYQMKILKLKNTVIKMKFSLDRLNSRLERNEERINELENESVQLIQSEEEKENTEVKLDKASEPQGGHHQAYTSICNGESRWEKRERDKTNIGRNNG